MLSKSKRDFLESNVGFHFSDLSYSRQLELKARPEEKEWVLLALSKDKLENWEKYGFALFDKPEFRKPVDNGLKMLEEENQERFDSAMRQDRRRKGIWVEEDTARRKFERMKKYWKYFRKGKFEAEDKKTYTFDFSTGITEYGKQRLYEVMALSKFEDLTEDEWFVLWTAGFTLNVRKEA